MTTVRELFFCIDKKAFPRYSHLIKVSLICVLIQAAIGVSPVFSQQAEKTVKAVNPKPPDSKLNPFDWLLSTDDELAFIPKGAVKDGITYDHLLHLEGSLNTQPLGLWAGGRLLVSAIQGLSGRPSENYIGDLQVASNISAKSTVRFYEFNYSQTFNTQSFDNRFVIAAGLIDMNKFFIKADHASVLLNSSFGISPDMSANAPTSIFPKPGFGISAAKYFSHWKIQGSIFQNDPNDRSDLSISRNMTTFEVDYKDAHGLTGQPVVLKAGFWHHTSINNIRALTGFYTIIQQTLLLSGQSSIGLFIQAGSSPYHASTVPYYAAVGMLVNAPFKNRPNDEFSLGMAKAITNINFSIAETAWEATYLLQISNHISIQPDFQYIENPGGITRGSAIVAFLRIHLEIH